MSERFALIEGVPRETISLGMLLGLIRYHERDDVYELTSVGHTWLNEWIQERLAEQKAAS